MFTQVKTDKEITAMRESGRLLATVLATLKEALQPGMSTKDLADLAARELRSTGGKPAFLGYYGFPDVLCVSINDEVVHGIPRHDRTFEKGDIVSMDFGVVYDGMITDAAVSVIAGGTAETTVKDLVRYTEQALLEGVAAAKGGGKVGDIAFAIQKVLDAKNYGIVRDLVGHGVGHDLHEDPNIPNYGKRGTGPILQPGMTIAIEPMATLGSYEVFIADDGWTVHTRDRSLAAHFEHTILLTDDGAEILTTL